jgi:segregation and condensation protein B
MNENYIKNVVEAALLAAGRPLQLTELVQLFDENARPDPAALRTALDSLDADYSGRGIEVKETATGFRIQVRREMANEVSRLWPERPPKYSRALLETLALIAYRQPITRAEIEAVRGVAVNPNIIKTILERNWVKVVGTRDVPGRPELLGTTREFLDYFGLKSLEDLPPLAELKAMGEINLQLDLAKPEEPGSGGSSEGSGGAAGAGGGLDTGTTGIAAAAVAANDAIGEPASNDENAGLPVATTAASSDAVLAEPVAAVEPADAALSEPAVAAESAEPPVATTAASSDAADPAVAPGEPISATESAELPVAATRGEPADVISEPISAEERAELAVATTTASSDPELVEAVAALSADSPTLNEPISIAESAELRAATTIAASAADLAPLPTEEAPDEAISVEANFTVEHDIAADTLLTHIEIESDPGDVTVEVEALTLMEPTFETSIESDEPPAASSHDASIETGQFELSELGISRAPASVIEAEFDAGDLDTNASDDDAADEEDEVTAKRNAKSGLVAARRRDRDD